MNSRQNIREDWSDSVDDMDGADWGDLMSGPDDDELSLKSCIGSTPDEWDMDYMDDDDAAVCDSVPLDATDDLEAVSEDMPGPGKRHSAIIQWLENPELNLKHLLRAGFFIDGGYMVRLEDGSIENILDWLENEGIWDGAELENYVVKLEDDEQGDRLCFYRILDAPFLPIHENKSYTSVDDFDDDVPF